MGSHGKNGIVGRKSYISRRVLKSQGRQWSTRGGIGQGGLMLMDRNDVKIVNSTQLLEVDAAVGNQKKVWNPMEGMEKVEWFQ